MFTCDLNTSSSSCPVLAFPTVHRMKREAWQNPFLVSHFDRIYLRIRGHLWWKFLKKVMICLFFFRCAVAVVRFVCCIDISPIFGVKMASNRIFISSVGKTIDAKLSSWSPFFIADFSLWSLMDDDRCRLKRMDWRVW